MNLLEVEPFEATFGAKSQRKRPKLQGAHSLEQLAQRAQQQELGYDGTLDSNVVRERELEMEQDKLLLKGQSARLWQELYKVLDASDVVVQVLLLPLLPSSRSLSPRSSMPAIPWARGRGVWSST